MNVNARTLYRASSKSTNNPSRGSTAMTKTADRKELHDNIVTGAVDAIRAIDVTTGTKEGKPDVRRLDKGAFYKIMDDHAGLTRDVIDRVGVGRDAVISAAAQVAAEDLAKKMQDARDAGDSQESLLTMRPSRVHVEMGSGMVATATVIPERKGKNPKTGEEVTTFGALSVRMKVSNSTLSGPQSTATDLVSKAMGLS